MRISWLLHATILAHQIASPTVAGETEVLFFESRIRPLLVEHCLRCHGPEKQWGGLRLDSRQEMLKGGETGPAVVPGQSEQSLLIHAVRHADEQVRMPRDGQLTEQQIRDLVKWIDDGAVFPSRLGAESRTRSPDHWSLQPLSRSPVPDLPVPSVPSGNENNPAESSGRAEPVSPVDAFILDRLQKSGLTFNRPADRTTLIRRLTYDLTGLPPTPEEIRRFVDDPEPDARERLIDRLLSSPAYGERWGRHWLDVARYADSNGLDENIAHGNAWRYRDYVVQAFHADKPFDQFIREQLAGDLLPFESESQRHEQLIATGFIAIGPKVLAEVNESKMRLDLVDEQIDTFGRVFLGLTLGCARCHDHKFDPIDTADYYGLAGIFRSTRTMDTYTKVAKWHENLLESEAATAAKADYEARLAASRAAIAALTAEQQRVAPAAATDRQNRGDSPQAESASDPAPDPDPAPVRLERLQSELMALEQNPPEFPSAMGVTEDLIVDLPIHVRGSADRLGAVVPRRTPLTIRGAKQPEFSAADSGRRQLAEWLVDPQHPLTARVIVNRVWRWHFGTGLVRTTENFGVQGELPSHPELLDWLAERLIADGWSLKSLHRLILNSATYGQSSAAAPDRVARDPDNRLLGRFSVRRLEAEEFRDSVLFASGQLDLTPGGSLLRVKNRGYLFDHTSIDQTDYSSLRRSLYLPVIRNNVYDVFQLLDFPDPAVPGGDRAMTTVAPQALMLLNSELVMNAAEGLAARLLAEPGDDAARYSLLCQTVWGRPATAAEQRENALFLDTVQASLPNPSQDSGMQRRGAWALACHVAFAASEFLYLQ